jgi:hypothetical protein
MRGFLQLEDGHTLLDCNILPSILSFVFADAHRQNYHLQSQVLRHHRQCQGQRGDSSSSRMVTLKPSNVELIIAILPYHATKIRRPVKHFGVVEQGIQTQCIVSNLYSPECLQLMITAGSESPFGLQHPTSISSFVFTDAHRKNDHTQVLGHHQQCQGQRGDSSSLRTATLFQTTTSRRSLPSILSFVFTDAHGQNHPLRS